MSFNFYESNLFACEYNEYGQWMRAGWKEQQRNQHSSQRYAVQDYSRHDVRDPYPQRTSVYTRMSALDFLLTVEEAAKKSIPVSYAPIQNMEVLEEIYDESSDYEVVDGEIYDVPADDGLVVYCFTCGVYHDEYEACAVSAVGLYSRGEDVCNSDGMNPIVEAEKGVVFSDTDVVDDRRSQIDPDIHWTPFPDSLKDVNDAIGSSHHLVDVLSRYTDYEGIDYYLRDIDTWLTDGQPEDGIKESFRSDGSIEFSRYLVKSCRSGELRKSGFNMSHYRHPINIVSVLLRLGIRVDVKDSQWNIDVMGLWCCIISAFHRHGIENGYDGVSSFLQKIEFGVYEAHSIVRDGRRFVSFLNGIVSVLSDFPGYMYWEDGTLYTYNNVDKKLVCLRIPLVVPVEKRFRHQFKYRVGGYAIAKFRTLLSIDGCDCDYDTFGLSYEGVAVYHVDETGRIGHSVCLRELSNYVDIYQVEMRVVRESPLAVGRTKDISDLATYFGDLVPLENYYWHCRVKGRIVSTTYVCVAQRKSRVAHIIWCAYPGDDELVLQLQMKQGPGMFATYREMSSVSLCCQGKGCNAYG